MAGLCDNQRLILSIFNPILGLGLSIFGGFIVKYLIDWYLHRTYPEKHKKAKLYPWPFWAVFIIVFLTGIYTEMLGARPAKICDNVAILKIVCEPLGDALDEVVTLQNIDNHTIDLDRWTLCDDENVHCYTFEHFKLAEQAVVELKSGMGTSTSAELYWNVKKTIWNNEGDTAHLLDPKGRIVDELTCPPQTVSTTTPIIPPTITAVGLPPAAFPTIKPKPLIPTSQLLVHFIDVGQGDAILIVTPEALTILIDGGSANTGVVDYLRGQGVERINLMVATHPNEDHLGGLVQVLAAMPVGRVITNGQPHTTATYEHFLDAVLASDAEYSEVQRGATLTLGKLNLSVLNPGDSLGDDLNENSVVLRLEYGQTAFLFMGDAGSAAESSMLAAGLPLKANILKVGHHASCDSLNDKFLEAVRPQVGIYTAGVNNQHRYPCQDTVDVLHRYGASVLGTDVNGSIIVTVTESGYLITNSAGVELGK